MYIDTQTLNVTDAPPGRSPRKRRCCGEPIRWDWGPGHYKIEDMIACDEQGRE